MPFQPSHEMNENIPPHPVHGSDVNQDRHSNSNRARGDSIFKDSRQSSGELSEAGSLKDQEAISSRRDFQSNAPPPQPLSKVGLLASSRVVNTASPARKSYKNPNLNISIPPPNPSVISGLGVSASDPNQDPITPLFQVVHTPTTAPGAPGPGDPAEIRRLEQSWAASMANLDQLSPAYPNFQPPTISDFPGLASYESNPTTTSYGFGKDNINGDERSAALREMFALTASAKTPTFAPPSLALDFGKPEERKINTKSSN